MSVFASICVIVYCLIGACFHWGIQQEWEADTTNDLDGLSPTFAHLSMMSMSAFWPLLVLVSLYQVFTKEKV